MARWPRLRNLGYRLEESSWGRRLTLKRIWKGLKKGLFLFFYLLWWFFVLLGGTLLSTLALTLTWNVGPAHLFGWNSMAYHEVIAVFIFVATLFYSWRGLRWFRDRFKSNTPETGEDSEGSIPE
jgi:hypothetical protein